MKKVTASIGGCGRWALEEGEPDGYSDSFAMSVTDEEWAVYSRVEAKVYQLDSLRDEDDA